MMKIKKMIIIIMISLLITLPMINMNSTVQALSYNLKSEMKGNTVYFTWNKIENVDGYDLYINTSNRGFEYIGSVTSEVAPVIGFQEGKTYTAKVCGYQISTSGTKVQGTFSEVINVNTNIQTTLSKVTTLTASQNGGVISLNWSKISNATGYQVFADIPSWGYVNLGNVEGANSALIKGGVEGETYYFKVRAYRTTSGTTEYGDFSPEKRVVINNSQYDDVPETKPAKVNNLTIDEVNGNTAYISWSKVSDAEGYEIYAAKSSENYKYLSTVYKNSATLKNLDYDTYYRIKVRAYKSGKNGTLYGEESSYKGFSTGINPNSTALNTVTNLSIDVDQTTAYLDWARVTDADGYQIYMTTENGPYYYKSTVYTNSATLKNLSYDTRYGVKVRAYKKISGTTYYGKFSATRYFTTDEQERIEQVKNVTVSNITGTTASVSWSKVSEADGYNIYLSKKSNNNFRYLKSTTANKNVTISNLDYDTLNYVKVSAYKIINGREVEGMASILKQFRTSAKQKIDAVTHLTATVKNRNEAYLTWWPVDEADGYEVYLATSSGSFRKIEELSASHTTIYSDELNYNTSYRVKVRAYEYVNGKKQYANYSSVVSFRTLSKISAEGNESIPRVSNLRANVIGDTVYLTWNKVSGAVKYEIDFTVPGIGGSIKFETTTNSRAISGLTEKTYKYTARVRAYKYVNGRLVAGPYSYVSEFSGK